MHEMEQNSKGSAQQSSSNYQGGGAHHHGQRTYQSKNNYQNNNNSSNNNTEKTYKRNWKSLHTEKKLQKPKSTIKIETMNE